MVDHGVQLLARADLFPTFHSPQEAIDYLTTAAVNINASKHMSFAFFCLLVYDHLLTLPEEVKIVWLGRPSFVKALFIFNRYFAPLFIAIDLATLSGAIYMNDQLCRSWLVVDVVFETMSLVSTTLIMAFRVHAVLGNIPGLLPYLLGIWAFQAVISAVLVLVLVIVKLAPTVVVAPFFGVCIAELQEFKVWTIWLPSMMFHTLVFSLLLWKAISTPRDTKTPMLMLLIRDGFIYFGVVFAAFLFNLLVWACSPLSLALLPHDSVWAIVTIALSRLMLSMDGISPSGLTTDQEEEDSQPVVRPLSHATLPIDFRRTLEKNLAFPRSRSQTTLSRSQTKQSMTETVNMQGSEQSLVDHGRRGSKGSNYSQKGKQKPAADFQADAVANPSWYPGAFEENPSALRSMSPSSIIPAATSRGTSPVPTSRSGSPQAPLAYVRPLPAIPGSSSLGRPSGRHSRSQSASPLPGNNSHRTSHQASVSVSGPVFNSSSQATALYGPPRSITPSNTHLMLRGSGAISPPDPDAPHYDAKHNPHHNTKNETLVPLAKGESHEMKSLAPRAPPGTFSSDSHPWVETPLPEIVAYSRAPQREIVDRRGGVKTSNFGGVEF